VVVYSMGVGWLEVKGRGVMGGWMELSEICSRKGRRAGDQRGSDDHSPITYLNWGSWQVRARVTSYI